jgi:two-component system, NarL family, nitrate/nitrite response regulator NarL
VARTDPTRVCVADSQPLFLEAIAAAIGQRPDLKLVARALSAADAVTAIATLRPDVALLALPLPGLSRPRLLELADSCGAHTRLLWLCSDIDGELIVDALARGAAGVLSKDIAGAAITDAVVAVHDGRTVLCPAVQCVLANVIRQRVRTDRPALTPREREILTLAADGRATRQIAARLDVAPSTIKTHLRSIYHKLDAPDRTSAVAAAIRGGLLDPPPRPPHAPARPMTAVGDPKPQAAQRPRPTARIQTSTARAGRGGNRGV